MDNAPHHTPQSSKLKKTKFSVPFSSPLLVDKDTCNNKDSRVASWLKTFDQPPGEINKRRTRKPEVNCNSQTVTAATGTAGGMICGSNDTAEMVTDDMVCPPVKDNVNASDKNNQSRVAVATTSTGLDNELNCSTNQQLHKPTASSVDTPTGRRSMVGCKRKRLSVTDDDCGDDKLKKSRVQLLQQVKEKEEELRKLKLVKLYRSKHDATKLDHLINKWRKVSQEALQELHDLSTAAEPALTVSELITHLQIDAKVVGYDEDEETFH